MLWIFLIRISIVECWSLFNIDRSPDASITLLNSGTQPCIYAFPGYIYVLFDIGTDVYTLDPITLISMPCKTLYTGDIDSNSNINNDIPRLQFNIIDCTLTILSALILMSTDQQRSISKMSTMILQ